ncbi:hypothetical protein [Acetivibrio cellulolyticus]|uniref:hypothetical protein n=1 Tax=Acetivibrio cellulolyticus TaxID=35830 RepID=UPI0001E2CCE1|nr:hypothetical protein [Acetivibrio cellulolyticus]
MKKVRATAISTIFFVVFIISLTSCGSLKDKSEVSESPSSTISKTNETTSTDSSTDHVTVMPTKPSTSTSGDNIKATDYNQYLKKIWVVKSWNGAAYDYFSFFISKIENGVIEGKLSTGSIAYPDFYSYSLEPSKYLGDLLGTINNAVAECRFSDKVGNKGNLTLVFKENDEIDAKIKYTDKGEAYKDLSLDGNYLFRPYKLADIKDFIPSKEHSFAIDLNSWGSVKFVSGEVNHGDKVYPAAYLINEHEDILYKFQAPFQTGFKIIEASIKDINNDGLKDVKITIGFIDDPNAEHIEWVFYQMSNGLFYDSKLNVN